jgi:hypothetical protein
MKLGTRAQLLILAAPAALALAACGASKSHATTPHRPPVHHAPPVHLAPPGTGGPTQPGGGTTGPEGIPIEQGPSLAPASSTTPGTPVDGVQCLPGEQVAYHVHAHLEVYVDGQPRQIPGGIGLIEPFSEQTPAGPLYGATQCYYWLHTHTADGIIHIESPTHRIYTLGQFFDEWRQALSSSSVADADGPVTALVNGRPWKRSPRAIPLVSREEVQLDVGKPVVPFHRVSFGRSGL